MASFATFDQDIRLATAGIAPDAIAKELAKLARSELRRVISTGEGSEVYDKYVNGRFGAEEETVVPPGPILYVFSIWGQVISFALEYLAQRSPVRSGRYRRSHIALVNMRPVASVLGNESFSARGGGYDVPVGAEVIITNPQPYTRKIETGAMTMSVPPKVYDDARKAVIRRFGGRENGLLDVRAMHILLPGGTLGGVKVPWILRNTQYRDLRPRRDAMAGMPIKYPALIMRMRD